MRHQTTDQTPTERETTMTHLEKILSTHGFMETGETRDGMDVWLRAHDGNLTEYVLVDDRQRRWIYNGNGPEKKGKTLRELAKALGLDSTEIFRPEDFNADEIGYLNMLPTAFLAAAARGEIDLNAMAKDAVADNGLDEYGDWIGFPKAEARMKGSMITRADGKRTWVQIPD